jgi:hypothetical protein
MVPDHCRISVSERSSLERLHTNRLPLFTTSSICAILALNLRHGRKQAREVDCTINGKMNRGACGRPILPRCFEARVFSWLNMTRRNDEEEQSDD